MPPPKGNKKEITLNLADFTAPPMPKTPAPKPKQVAKPIVKQPPVLKQEEIKEIKEVEKLVVKEKLVDSKDSTFIKKVEKKKKPVTKVELKKKIVKKKKTKKKKLIKKRRETKKRVVKKRRSNSDLANSLLNAASFNPMPTSRSSRSTRKSYNKRMIKQLYGSEFNTYSHTQKKFIKNNLGTIHRITQQTLNRNGYPEVAARTGQQGTNVVSFYLHPNGDISKLRLKTRIGYRSLDNNTLEVIRIAYKDYPLPNQKTKIIFYVQYSIY